MALQETLALKDLWNEITKQWKKMWTTFSKKERNEQWCTILSEAAYKKNITIKPIMSCYLESSNQRS